MRGARRGRCGWGAGIFGEGMALPSLSRLRYMTNLPLRESPMATLTIRNLDIQVEEALRLRAARNGRSIEAEARAILAETVVSPPRETIDLAEAIRRRFAPLGGAELEPHPPVVIKQQRDKAQEIMKRRRYALRELTD